KIEDYINNKVMYKNELRQSMINLKNHLSNKENLKQFLEQSFFNNETASFCLCIADDNESFHIFNGRDVIEKLVQNIVLVDNSRGEQKVIFKSPVGRDGQV